MGNLFAAGLRRPALECEIVSCPQARERRRTGIHLGFGSRPRPLPTGAVSIGAGIRDGAWAQLADPKTKGRGSGGNGSGRRLVIVESPTKARKLASYLGSGYIVESSRGHIRDLPRAASDVPAKYKSQPWARLGVNVDADFEPLYIISPEKRSTVSELRGLLKDVDELYLATDGDREGEAIAWHLLETLKPRIPAHRSPCLLWSLPHTPLRSLLTSGWVWACVTESVCYVECRR